MPGTARISFEPTKPLPWLAVAVLVLNFADYVVGCL